MGSGVVGGRHGHSLASNEIGSAAMLAGAEVQILGALGCQTREIPQA